MASYIAVGDEFINIDKACHIDVYTNQYNTVLVCIEYEHSSKEIPCEGTEEEVRKEVRVALHHATAHFCTGPNRARGFQEEET